MYQMKNNKYVRTNRHNNIIPNTILLYLVHKVFLI